MVSPLERPPSQPSPSFDSVDLTSEDDRSLAARFDRGLTALDRLRDRPGASLAMAAVATALLLSAWWLGRQPSVDATSIPMVTTTAAGLSTPTVSDVVEPAGVDGEGGAQPEGAASTGEVVTTVAAPVLVHVAGAVARPGVVRLAAGDRIADAVEAAGGPLDEAEVHRLNLAAPVVDGMQVRVPVAGEEVTHPTGVAPPAPPAGTTGGGGGPDPAETEPINLNRADAAQLEALHGIGPALAAAIITWRTETGPFAAVEELLDVPGIGPATLDGLVDQVTV